MGSSLFFFTLRLFFTPLVYFQVAFIPVNGVPTKASKLFDPRTVVLKEIFGDEPDAFPAGEFGEESWLDVLVDIGLKNKLDRDTILQCAKKVRVSFFLRSVCTGRQSTPTGIPCHIAHQPCTVRSGEMTPPPRPILKALLLNKPSLCQRQQG